MLPLSHPPSATAKPLGDARLRKKTASAAACFVHGRPSAGMVSSSVGVLTVLLLSTMVFRGFWNSTPPVTSVLSSPTAFKFEADSPPLPLELTVEGKTRGDPLLPARRWWEVAWFAEVKGCNCTHVNKSNEALGWDLDSARYTPLAKTKGEDYARTRHRSPT